MNKTSNNGTTESNGDGDPQQPEQFPQLYARDAETEALLRRHLVSIHDEIARGTIIDPVLIKRLDAGFRPVESAARPA